MKDAIRRTKRIFGQWKDEKKHEACSALHSLSAGDIAWDLVELHGQVTDDTLNKPSRGEKMTFYPCATPGAKPACGSSVTVDNSCHFAGSANYVIWGVMCRLCYNHYITKLHTLKAYELIDRAAYEYGKLHFSMTGMLRLIDIYKKYVPQLVLDAPASNIHAAKRWSIAGYNGWPSGAPTPEPDRANCELICTAKAPVPKLKISWYPFLNPYQRRGSIRPY